MTTRTRSWVVTAVATVLVAVFVVWLVQTLATSDPADGADATSVTAPSAPPSPGLTSPADDEDEAQPDDVKAAPEAPADPAETAPDGAAEPAPEADAGAPEAGAPLDRGQGAPAPDDSRAPSRPTGPAPTPTPTPTPTPDVSVGWDGSASGGLTVSGSLWGTVTVVPGDADTRTVTVRNDGPTDGVLTASIVNATAFRDPADPQWVDDSFYDDLTINGVPGTTLEGAATRIHEVKLARGATAEIPLSFAFDGWSGNRGGGGLEMPSGVIVNPDGVGPRVFTFDVELRITGDAHSDAPSDKHGTGVVTQTGGAALPRSPWLLLAAAALLLVAAGTSRALYRRPVAERAAQD